MKNIDNKIELLAPAGGKNQYIAAVENGADAIYLGGSFFNARIGADNFSLSEMERAIDYGHLRNVKTYVTLNTLMGDNQLNKALHYAKDLYEIGVDALIIQDLGLGNLIHKHFPKFPLHLSTQATIYNAEGIRLAKKLGYERVVVARELSLEEIKACTKENVEIETFVHGAICLCYSGQCQFSRILGGRSGNKGVCAQPCRLPYESAKSADAGFLLSPKDMALIDNLDDLVKADVKSFKIEGRMKSPEYVAQVVSTYRKQLDKIIQGFKENAITKEDRQNLLQIFNRNGFTEAFLKKGNPKDFLSGKISKNNGVLAGTVVSDSRKNLIDIKPLTSKSIEQGDIIEIRSKSEEPRTTTKVTFIKALDGKILRIGDLKEKVFRGDKIYRMISEEQMKDLRRTFGEADFDKGRGLKKAPISMEINLSKDLPVELTLIDGDLQVNISDEEIICSEALNRPITEADVKKQLEKTGDSPFYLEKVKVDLGENLYLPLASLNKIRREGLEKLSELKISFSKKYERGIKATYEEKDAFLEEKGLEFWFSDLEDFHSRPVKLLEEKIKATGLKSEEIQYALPIYDLMQSENRQIFYKENSNIKIIPYIENLTKGRMDLWLRGKGDEILDFVEKLEGKLYLGNLGQVEMFSDKAKSRGIELLWDYGLNVYNNETKALLKSLGLKTGVDSLESVSFDVGKIPLMTTEYIMDYEELIDRKGAKYEVSVNDISHKTLIRKKELKVDWKKIKEIFAEKSALIRVYF